MSTLDQLLLSYFSEIKKKKHDNHNNNWINGKSMQKINMICAVRGERERGRGRGRERDYIGIHVYRAWYNVCVVIYPNNKLKKTQQQLQQQQKNYKYAIEKR